MNSVKMTLLSTSPHSSVDRTPARCLGGHGFDSCWGLRFFFVPCLCHIDQYSSFTHCSAYGFFSSLGAKDISAAIGMPPMQNHQHIDNLAAHYKHQRHMSNTSGQNNKKRKRTELQRDEQDMEVEEEGENSLFWGI